MGFKSRCISGRALLLLATLITLTLTSHAQKRSESVFEAVPLDSRGRLLERLNEYVAREKGQQYEELYDMIYELNDKDASKEAYSKARREVEGRWGVVQKFTPKFVLDVTFRFGEPPTYRIMGISKVLCKGKISDREMTISARLKDGEWYFSELSDSFLHID